MILFIQLPRTNINRVVSQDWYIIGHIVSDVNCTSKLHDTRVQSSVWITSQQKNEPLWQAISSQWGMSPSGNSVATIVVPYHEVKFLQLIWRSGMLNFIYVWPIVKLLQSLDLKTEHRDISTSNCHQDNMSYFLTNALKPCIPVPSTCNMQPLKRGTRTHDWEAGQIFMQ